MFLDPYSTLVRAPKPQHVLDLVCDTPPADAPVSLAELKAHIRVDSASEDALIQDALDGAVSLLDGYSGVLGRCLLAQTWTWSLSHFPCHAIDLPLARLISIEEIRYLDPDGADQLLDPSAYLALTGERAAIEPAYGTFWPSARCQSRSVRIKFRAGYGAAAGDVPRAIKAAIKLIAADLYANRETTLIGERAAIVENPAAAALVAPFRVLRT